MSQKKREAWPQEAFASINNYYHLNIEVDVFLFFHVSAIFLVPAPSISIWIITDGSISHIAIPFVINFCKIDHPE